MRNLLAVVLLCGSCLATTPIIGNLKDPATNSVSSGAFLRIWLRGCSTNQPRVNGVALIPPRGSSTYYADFAPDPSGVISGTVYSTRDAAGTGNGEIQCGSSYTAVWLGIQPYFNGVAGTETPVHSKNGVSLDISNVTAITTTPVVTAPTGDSTYFRLDGGNSPITGPFTSQGNDYFTGTTTGVGDFLFKSGRPWYDVMAFGAKNDNATDDTAAIQAAMTAACATTPPGGIIYFPKGAGYKIAGTSTPFVISCSNLAFLGEGWMQEDTPEPASYIIGPNLTAPMFSNTGSPQGLSWQDLGLIGNSASANAVAINLTGNTIARIERNFFDQWGGSAIQNTSPFGIWLINNWAQNCLMQRPAVDDGCFDLTNNDVIASGNFVTTSVATSAGNIGTGHTYAWVVRGSNGFYTNNMGEISQHGWLITGSNNTLIGNRSFLIQGNGYHVTGVGNIFSGNKALASSQTATNTFDAFLCDGLCSSNIFSDNFIDDVGNNGNHTRHAFSDSNSNGSGEPVGNKYSNNKLGNNGVLGVLYNMTGSSPYSIQQPHRISPDRGDASVTIQCNVDAETQWFQTVLTATRTVTLSTTGAYNGCHFKIVRSDQATGVFNLNVASSTGNAVLGVAGQSADAEFINSQWRITAYSAAFLNGSTGSGAAVLGASPNIASPTITGGPIAGGTAAVLTGTGACATITTQAGGSWGGTAKCTGVTAASTLTITPGSTAPNGWTCYVQDETSRANLFQQTSHSTTACVLTVTSVTQNDVFVFSAIPY